MGLKFEDAVQFILEFEGGYVWDSNDPGGETNHGISKRSYPKLDIKSLTIEEAKSIYKRDYWNKIKADEMPPSLRLMAFDCAVNQGVRTAILILQKSISVKADGIIGVITLKAMDLMDETQLLMNYALLRQKRYANNPKWAFFGKGWSSRLLKCTINSMAFT